MDWRGAGAVCEGLLVLEEEVCVRARLERSVSWTPGAEGAPVVWVV